MKILIAFFCFLALHVNGQDITTAASNFLQSLDGKERTKAQYPIESEERFNWHFVPRERKGACFRNFTTEQRNTALDLIKASLSEQGFLKATSIMALENVLREIENRTTSDPHRDPLNYYITIFGTPSKVEPWGWRLEGHHVAFNFVSMKNQLSSSTPSFFGSNPGIVPSGPEKGKEILKQETDLGFQLINSFDDQKKKKAMLSETALPEIVSFNNRKAVALTPEGLNYTEMDESQQKLLMQLLNVYVKNYQLGFSNKLMEKIRAAGINRLSFAWAGALSPGSGNYYRIQGPMLLIEYDNTQTNANHVHATVRDLTNDFAEDILKEHYLSDHR
ncbi:DUF3500 domain-containing protein [soil metagenome]